jgi:membrane fusion protein (multidrug efflux system)
VPIIPIVENANWWIDANFKETDLTRIRAGQKATVTIDIYPGQEFSGTVEAISPVSTNAFSLLPPENATGSWIKLTQRFPVHVGLTLKPGDPQMRLGASANVTVDTTD